MIGGAPYTIATRYTYTTEPIQKATQYAYEHFDALGLPVQYHTYNLSGMKRNVIAEQPGLSQPERIFMVTAHLDDTSQSPYTLAPGADDNGSGSTGVLIAADILSQFDFDCTIRYALFTGEEQGLVGSYYYAQDAYANGDDIEGVLNLDMIAYNSDLYPQIELHTRPGNPSDLAIANLFSDVVDAYNLNLVPEIVQDGISCQRPLLRSGSSGTRRSWGSKTSTISPPTTIPPATRWRPWTSTILPTSSRRRSAPWRTWAACSTRGR